jgi:hypothetical protein
MDFNYLELELSDELWYKDVLLNYTYESEVQ